MTLLILLRLFVSEFRTKNSLSDNPYQPQGALIAPVAPRKRTGVARPDRDLVDLTRFVLALDRVGVSNVIKPC